MINHNKYNRGYIGLIALLIVVTIMVFLMINQYERLHTDQLKTESVIDSNSSPTVDSPTMAPIDRAQNIKNVLEDRDRDRSLLSQ